MEGKLKKERIKDWTSKKQSEYYGGFVKEVVQEASFKRKNWGYDAKLKREKCVKNTFNKLHKEGLVKQFPDFMKNALHLNIERRKP